MLQGDLDRLFEWSNVWKLEFKAVKSNEVIFHAKNRKVGIISTAPCTENQN
jgi:hypothetical protein